MNGNLAYCGLDCGACEARIATVTGDEALRRKVAAEWSELNGVTITPEMIRCDGCRADGAKTVYCESICPIRPCARGRGFRTCADCGDFDICERLAAITGNNPAARRRLEEERGA